MISRIADLPFAVILAPFVVVGFVVGYVASADGQSWLSAVVIGVQVASILVLLLAVVFLAAAGMKMRALRDSLRERRR